MSRSLASKFREYRHNKKPAVKPIRHDLLQIQCELSFGQLKALLRSRPALLLASGKVFVPSTLIPEHMPPREIPGCWFQLPQSDRWRIEHRTVTL